MTNKIINFYRVNEPYGFFSNFSLHPIYLLDKWWPTSEHYFQAQKFEDLKTQEKIRAAKTPRAAAQLGRDRTLSLRPNWEDIKEDVMRVALYAKFTQHQELKASLLATSGYTLQEHTSNDNYWGDGGDGTGLNRLGFLLMELREKLKTNETNS